ncbi:PIN domain-containing protein [Nigerium massiliense]|uniref:PIN domain-containing protein n=1 Tax=Nigerium massiliense TaxID=1522317 RepID=UPI001C48DA66
MIVLDTNVVSEVLRPRPDAYVVAWLEAVTDDVAITAVTLAELLAGLRRLPDGRRKSDLTGRVESAIRPYRDTGAILSFDALAAPPAMPTFSLREKPRACRSPQGMRRSRQSVESETPCARRATPRTSLKPVLM